MEENLVCFPRKMGGGERDGGTEESRLPVIASRNEGVAGMVTPSFL
jgi:hypothetical protein